MANKVKGTIFFIITLLCIFLPYYNVGKANEPHQVTVGPNQLYFWTSDCKTILSGTYTLYSTSYFEIWTDDQHTVQSTLEVPPPGETTGRYWIRDVRIDGLTSIKHAGAHIFSLEQNSITVVPQFFAKLFNAILGGFIGFLVWIVLLYIIDKAFS